MNRQVAGRREKQIHPTKNVGGKEIRRSSKHILKIPDAYEQWENLYFQCAENSDKTVDRYGTST